MAAEYVVTLRVQTLGEAQELWEEAADLLGPRLLERTITRAEQDATAEPVRAPAGRTARRARQLPDSPAMIWLWRELVRPAVRDEGYPVEQLVWLAEDEGFNIYALRRAKKRLGVETYRRSFGGEWWWRLSDDG